MRYTADTQLIAARRAANVARRRLTEAKKVHASALELLTLLPGVTANLHALRKLATPADLAAAQRRALIDGGALTYLLGEQLPPLNAAWERAMETGEWRTNVECMGGQAKRVAGAVQAMRRWTHDHNWTAVHEARVAEATAMVEKLLASADAEWDAQEIALAVATAEASAAAAAAAEARVGRAA